MIVIIATCLKRVCLCDGGSTNNVLTKRTLNEGATQTHQNIIEIFQSNEQFLGFFPLSTFPQCPPSLSLLFSGNYR